MLRWTTRLLAVGLVLVIAVGAAAALLLWASLPKLDGEQRLRGLQAPVEVLRDHRGVPTVTASSRVDAARATGFLHAQERFFQMDLSRRSAAGELAALVGEAALPVDRERRIFDMRAVARRQLLALDRDEQALLYAYAEGVNAGLGAMLAHPFEYLLLRQTPEAWRAEDSLLVAGAMYFMLTDDRASHALQRAQLLGAGGQALHDYLLPGRTPWDAPLQGEAGPLPEPPAAEALDLRALPVEWFEGEAAETRRISGLGSNAFALSAARSGQGSALIAGDMHLGLSVPNSWYRLRLRVEGGEARDVTGVTLPGLPLIIAGSNGHLAWAFTNSYGIWSERIAVPAEETRLRDISLAVAGGEPVTMTVRQHALGPVVPGTREGEWHALRWLPTQRGVANLQLLALETAADVEAGVAAMNGAGIPPQSALLGDAEGRIAWTIAGHLPARSGAAPALPLPEISPGSWEGWLAAEDYPRIIDPPEGLLVSANARLLEGADLELIGDAGYAFGARQRRLRERAAAAEALDPDGALAIQSDVRSDWLDAWAQALDALLVKAVDHPAQDALQALLGAWEAEAHIDNAAYSLVRGWQHEVHNRAVHALTAAVRDQHPEFVLDAFPVSQAAVLDLVQRQPEHLLDPRYENWQHFLLAALDAALADTDDGAMAPTWGERNRLRMRHPLSAALPGLARWLDMPSEPMPGDADVVRVQGPAFGASQRMALTVGAESQGIFHMPGGQSGHPLSAHYRAGHDDWVAARPATLLPEEARRRLELQP